MEGYIFANNSPASSEFVVNKFNNISADTTVFPNKHDKTI
jgi:hypothetical protein